MKSVVLINVGTPSSPEPQDVGVYLREFLMDENILPLKRPWRDLLVKAVIVPRRKFSSAEKYHKIWTTEGSPLMVHSKALQKELQAKLGSDWKVWIGMQVGEPSLRSVINEAAAVSTEVYFVPLYPQYSLATTGGAVALIRKSMEKAQVLKPFYNEAWFLKSQVARIRERLRPQDHLLLSYHGLPVSLLKKKNPSCQASQDCCMEKKACLQNCYKAQCHETTRLLKQELGDVPIRMSFQSRLGRGEWTGPATLDVARELAQKGVKHLKVACPSFVADCLETLEEIGMELRQEFLASGGESFELIPCVNSHPDFVHGLSAALTATAPPEWR